MNYLQNTILSENYTYKPQYTISYLDEMFRITNPETERLMGAREMDQWVKSLVAKSGNPNSTPGPHTVKRKN